MDTSIIYLLYPFYALLYFLQLFIYFFYEKYFLFTSFLAANPTCSKRPPDFQANENMTDSIIYWSRQYVQGRDRLNHLASSYSFMIFKQHKAYSFIFPDLIGYLVCVYNFQRLQFFPWTETGWGCRNKYADPLAYLLGFTCLYETWNLGNIILHA